MADNPAKALIRPLEGDTTEIHCLFNPKEYSIAKSNKWSVPPAKGKNLGEYEFGGGDPAKMTLTLMFDTYESGEDAAFLRRGSRVEQEAIALIEALALASPQFPDLISKIQHAKEWAVSS